MGVREEIHRIPKLKNMGLALIDYVESLYPGIAFKLTNLCKIVLTFYFHLAKKTA